METANFKGNERYVNLKIQFKNMNRYDLDKYRLKIQIFRQKEGVMKKNELLGLVNLKLSSISPFTIKEVHVAPIYDM